MKILIVVGKLSYGGVSIALENMVNALCKSNIDFEICSIFQNDKNEEKKVTCPVRILFSNKNKFIISKIVKLIPGFIWRRLLHIDRYDKVILYGADAILLCGFSVNKKNLICWIHDNPIFADGKNFSRYRSWKSKLTIVRKRKAYDNARKIVCVSEQCLQNFFEVWGYREKLITLNNIIDIEEIRNKSIEYIPEYDNDFINVVAVGRLSYEKAYYRVIEAMKAAIDNGIKVCCYIVGDGERRTELQELINSYQLSKHVILVGRKKNPYPYIGGADLVVISSISEAYSTVAIESQILGIPTLTTNCCGMHDIFDGTESGYICENDDSSFISSFVEYLKNKDEVIRKKYKAKEYSKNMNMNKTTEKIKIFLLDEWI